MFSKIFAAFAVTLMFVVGIVACNSDNLPAAMSNFDNAVQNAVSADVGDGDELRDDAVSSAQLGGGGAVSAVTNPVKYKINVTGGCVPGDPARFKYISVVADPSQFLNGQANNGPNSAFAAKLGWKSFTVATTKFGKDLYKTLDKTKTYMIYIQNADKLGYTYKAQLNPNPATDAPKSAASTAVLKETEVHRLFCQ